MGFRLKKNCHTLKQREGVRWGGGEQPVPEGSKDRLGTGSLWLRGGEGRLTRGSLPGRAPKLLSVTSGLAWGRFPRSDLRPLGPEL